MSSVRPQKFFLATLVAAFACSADRTVAPTLNPDHSTPSVGIDVPSRHRWSSDSDSALWQAVMERDSVFAIGLKTPGTSRGVARGRPTISRRDWQGAIAAIVHQAGVQVVKIDSTELPRVYARMADIGVMTALRRLPFVDFLEPAYMRPIYMDHCDYSALANSSGGSSDGQTQYGGELIAEPLPGQPGLVDYVGREFLSMKVDYAWQVTAGSGVTVGVTDTGLDVDYPSEFSSRFSSASSAGRWLIYDNAPMGTAATCSHGTRISGLVGAPRDGVTFVGVAYGANMYNVHQADGENPDVSLAADAIHRAVVNGGARVVVMAWGELNWYDNVSNEIDAHYYNDDVMFVGASGTCPAGGYCPHMGSAVFPAEKEEVLAVTGANYGDGSRPSNMYDYGNKSGVVAYTNLPTTGFGDAREAIVNIAGSSGATGAVGGIATLVRAASPSLTNRSVMDRIIQTSGKECAGSEPAVWRDALVNAYAALGGICISREVGPALIVFYDGNSQDSTVTYSVRAYQGFGPITYHWMNGATTPSITVTYDAVADSQSDTSDGLHYVWVDVQDTGSPNPPWRMSVTTKVINNMSTSGGGCTPVPPQITC